ncbi:Programmed cell death toxin YdcE [hydrothermal vent metagenome]|uniref:Programmed cell death toxin YdcE n=1 Tax=hydrothermal vent metagenome TaxID=652676 RepID=A0A3B0VR10_9ZZZZ
MVEVQQGEVWWADLSEPVGSGPGFRRPILVVQGNPFNESKISTIVCIPLTSNLKWADAPGNLLLKKRVTGLKKDSVANVSQIISLDKSVLTDRCGRISGSLLKQIFHGLNIVFNK